MGGSALAYQLLRLEVAASQIGDHAVLDTVERVVALAQPTK
jgi:hypothetical protein